MALPASQIQWPPTNPVREDQNRFSAWFAGYDPALHTAPLTDPDPSGMSGGVDKKRRLVGSNLAADLASVAADLLMGTPPSITPEDTTVDEATTGSLVRLAEDAGLWRTLREAAELASAHGEVYVRAIADPTVLATPVLEAVPATSVQPTFRYGQLTRALMWTIVGTTSGGGVWWWVEERDNVTKTIRNGLYLGTTKSLGSREALTAHPATADLSEETPYPAGVNSMVWHLVNAKPSRRAPETAHGRSDLEGCESLLASLDAAFSSLARDIRLGQARMLVPSAALSRPGTGGTGSFWDNSREVFTDLDLDPNSPTAKPELLQPVIRTQEHVDAINSLTQRIISTAGYSPSTFGYGEMGAAESGTALRVRQARTISTITTRRSLWTPAVEGIIETLAVLGRTVHGLDVPVVPVTVTWPELVTPDPESTARTVSLLMTANAMSVEEAVSQLHPAWGSDEAQAEVDRIREGLPADGALGF